METGRQFITTTPATNADRNASLGLSYEQRVGRDRPPSIERHAALARIFLDKEAAPRRIDQSRSLRGEPKDCGFFDLSQSGERPER
jgi:hypothetical protein